MLSDFLAVDDNTLPGEVGDALVEVGIVVLGIYSFAWAEEWLILTKVGSVRLRQILAAVVWVYPFRIYVIVPSEKTLGNDEHMVLVEPFPRVSENIVHRCVLPAPSLAAQGATLTVLPKQLLTRKLGKN